MNTASVSVSQSQAIPKLRWLRIVPPILITCIISYMDRVNIAFAMPGGMDDELGITASMAGLAGGIFFIGYLFLQVPGGRAAVQRRDAVAVDHSGRLCPTPPAAQSESGTTQPGDAG